jgi:hypothetical protein
MFSYWLGYVGVPVIIIIISSSSSSSSIIIIIIIIISIIIIKIKEKPIKAFEERSNKSLLNVGNFNHFDTTRHQTPKSTS